MNRQRHFLTLLDHTEEELQELLNMADQLKYEQKNGIAHPHLNGKTLGLIFGELSTRTRVSFEVGMYQLGGMALFLSARDLQMDRGEPMQDTARVLGGYLDGMIIRTQEQSAVEVLAEFAGVPVINGMTAFAHPCQVLADLMIIREYKRTFKGKKLCFIGPGSNVALTWAETADGFSLTNDPLTAISGADAVYAGQWDAFFQKIPAETRKKVFPNYQVNGILLRNAKPDAIVLHSLPARRGEEITAEVFEEHAGEIFAQAENRLHGQKAVLLKLLGGQ